MIVKRVGVLSLAKIMGILYAGLGLIGGACFALVSMMGGDAFPHHAGGFGMRLGAGAIVLFPLLYGALGFIAGIISAWLYNLAAGFIGGVELELQ